LWGKANNRPHTVANQCPFLHLSVFSSSLLWFCFCRRIPNRHDHRRRGVGVFRRAIL